MTDHAAPATIYAADVSVRPENSQGVFSTVRFEFHCDHHPDADEVIRRCRELGWETRYVGGVTRVSR